MQRQLWYANEMWFDFRIVIDEEVVFNTFHAVVSRINPDSPHFDPFYTEIVFVHCETEAVLLPNNIIAAWPRDELDAQHGHWPQGLVSGINWAINRDEIDLTHFLHGQLRDAICLTDYGLSYPLMVSDKVDYWEKVSVLWQALSQSERSDIRRIASSYATRD